MTPVAVRSQYSSFYGSSMLPVLEEVFRQEFQQHESKREMLFKVVPWDRDIYQSQEIHDLDLFQQVAEGAEYSFKRSKQGAPKTLVVLKYGLGVSISEEMVEDGKMDLLGDMIRRLGRSARESQEIAAMNIFNNGFSTETTADGVALFSASHTLPTGGTMSNILATAADLSVTSLDQMRTNFETAQVGDTGIIYSIKPRGILVHSSQRRYASELVAPGGKPDTADNNKNSMADEGLIVVSSPHLTDTDAWFMFGDKQDTGLRIIQRKAVETKAGGPDLGFLTDSILYKSRYREVIGALHPYALMGTPGA